MKVLQIRSRSDVSCLHLMQFKWVRAPALATDEEDAAVELELADDDFVQVFGLRVGLPSVVVAGSQLSHRAQA
jgi:hypothetical protein